MGGKVASLGRVWVRFPLHKSWRLFGIKHIGLLYKMAKSCLEKPSTDEATFSPVSCRAPHFNPFRLFKNSKQKPIFKFIFFVLLKVFFRNSSIRREKKLLAPVLRQKNIFFHLLVSVSREFLKFSASV